MAWKPIVREPLVHFMVIGALLFAFDAWRGPSQRAEPPPPAAPPSLPAPAAPPSATGPIVIDAEVLARVRIQAERRLGRAPTAAEVDAEIARWVDEEVLFREAIARGLERDDPVIHKRIADRMTFVLEQSLIVVEPTDAELQAWFESHRDQWAQPARVDFTHVFVAGTDAAATARIGELETALAAGAVAERLGELFPGGRRYRGRKPADLALAFGDEFVAGLAAQPLGTWHRRTSRHGMHLVRVDRVEAGRAADLATARLDVRKSWLEDRRASELAAATQRLRARWEIVKR
jgi:hypothetical protein